MRTLALSIALVVVVSLTIVAVSNCQPTPQIVAGDQQISIQVGDQTRTYFLHVPPQYDGARALPLVIVMHGSGGNGKAMANATGFSPIADREGFIVAYPDGITGKNHGWTAPYGKPIPGGAGAQVDDIDDVGFIRTLIDQLHNACHTDPARVYACGHSAGAYMAYRVANDLADRVAAAGVVNGSFTIRLLDGEPSIPDIPAPVAPVSIIHVRGGKDNLVKFEGGKTTRALAFSVPQCIDHFVKADGCATPPKETRDAEHAVTRTLYAGGKAGSEVELIVVDNANHNWPNAPQGLATSQGLWSFFAAHPKAVAP